MTQRAVPAFLVLIGLLVTWLIGFMNYRTYTNIHRQWQAQSWPKVAAVVDSSRVLVEDSGDGVSYIPQVAYRYQVNGRTYRGHRVRCGFNFTGRDWANQVIARFPAGQTAELSVNPADPSDSLLLTGIDSRDWQAVLFLMPFNSIVAGLLLSPWLIGKGYPESRARGRLYLHLQYQNPLGRALLAIFVTGFLSIFVSALLFRMEVPGAFCQLEFLLVATSGPLAAWLARRNNQDLSQALEVEPGQAFTSPQTGRRPLNQISDFELETEVTSDSDGDPVNLYWIALRDLEGQCHRLHKAANLESGQSAVDWLKRATDKR